MKANYDAKSFWAGVSVGTQLHGKGAFGVMEGWNPDGDLILRPITQGVGRISFGDTGNFTVQAFTDSVSCGHPSQEIPLFLQGVGRISFGGGGTFSVQAFNERLVFDQVVKAFTINATINPLDYDDTVVYINSNGAFAIDGTTATSPQELTCTVDMSHESISGIKLLSAAYSGTVTLCHRITGGEWSAPVALSDWIAQDCTTLYESLNEDKLLYLKFFLYDGAEFTSLVITYIN